jgi:hypothetical protein
MREATSNSNDGASPLAAVVTRKPITPPSITRRAPRRSCSRPAGMSDAASAIRKPVATQATSATDRSK